ncbi:MAG: M67 family metallopeptidase [Cyanobacteria bacterium P01_A01_bin.17]
MLTVHSDQLQTIKDHGERAYAEECCGLLIGYSVLAEGVWHRTVQGVELAPNAWDKQTEWHQTEGFSATRRYAIAPEDLLHTQKVARALGCDIIGVYHSHPDQSAVPSECDRKWAWPQYSYVIVSVQQGIACDLRSWMLDEDDRFQPETIIVNSHQ